MTTIPERVDDLDWTDLTRQLDERGFAITPPLLGVGECREARTCCGRSRARS